MDEMKIGFFARIALAFKVIFSAHVASLLFAALQDERGKKLGAPLPGTPEEAPEKKAQGEPEPEAEPKPGPEELSEPEVNRGAKLLLSVLQQEGRFVDFIHEDVAGFSDAEVGGAARVVHEGCRKALSRYLKFEPLEKTEEGSPMTVEGGFDSGKFRLTGNVTGKGPYKGTLAHPGWVLTQIELPSYGGALEKNIVAPAEVEIV